MTGFETDIEERIKEMDIDILILQKQILEIREKILFKEEFLRRAAFEYTLSLAGGGNP